MPWTVPYQPDFYRTSYHYSNLCYGASLLSLCDLAFEKGYAFVGCNSHGNNAYFVRNESLGSLAPLSPAEGFVCSRFSEGRDINGQWTLSKGMKRLEEIAGAEVYNTRSGKLEKILQQS